MRFLEFNERGRKEIQSSDAFKKEQNVKLVTNFAAAHHVVGNVSRAYERPRGPAVVTGDLTRSGPPVATSSILV